MFHIGQEVICVNDDFTNSFKLSDEKFPVKGSIYHIRDIEDVHGEIGLRLEELVNPQRTGFGSKEPWECCFKSARFRPLTKSTYDQFVHGSIDPDTEKYDNRRKKVIIKEKERT